MLREVIGSERAVPRLAVTVALPPPFSPPRPLTRSDHRLFDMTLSVDSVHKMNATFASLCEAAVKYHAALSVDSRPPWPCEGVMRSVCGVRGTRGARADVCDRR